MVKIIASNDKYVKEFVDSGIHIIYKNGLIYKFFKKPGTLKIKKNKMYYGQTSSGYYVISYKGKKLPVHRIVYYYFNKRLDDTKVVNHKNQNKKDNRISNLEMISSYQNSLEPFLKGKNNSTKLNWKKICKIRSDYKNGKTSIPHLAKKYNMHNHSISRIIKEKTWSLNQKKPLKKTISRFEALEKIVNDKNFKILKNGTIFSNIKKKGFKKIESTKKQNVYKSVKYQSCRIPIHRIIARKFIGKIQENMVVNHKDGNIHNNQLSNLEIVTQSQNMIHSARVLKKKPKAIVHELKKEIIDLFNQGYTLYKISKILKLDIRSVKRTLTFEIKGEK